MNRPEQTLEASQPQSSNNSLSRDEDIEEDIEEVPNTEGHSDFKFSSREAGLARLERLDVGLFDMLKKTNHILIFDLFMREMRSRISQLEPNTFELLWMKLCYNICLDYKNAPNLETDVEEIQTYMKVTPICEQLQMFIDLAQYKSNFAFNRYKKMQDTDVTEQELNEAFIKKKEKSTVYRNYVSLYNACLGNAKPKVINNSNNKPQYAATTYNKYDKQQKKNRFAKSTDTNDQDNRRPKRAYQQFPRIQSQYAETVFEDYETVAPIAPVAPVAPPSTFQSTHTAPIVNRNSRAPAADEAPYKNPDPRFPELQKTTFSAYQTQSTFNNRGRGRGKFFSNNPDNRVDNRVDTRVDNRVDNRVDTRTDTRVDTRTDFGRGGSSRGNFGRGGTNRGRGGSFNRAAQ